MNTHKRPLTCKRCGILLAIQTPHGLLLDGARLKDKATLECRKCGGRERLSPFAIADKLVGLILAAFFAFLFGALTGISGFLKEKCP